MKLPIVKSFALYGGLLNTLFLLSQTGSIYGNGLYVNLNLGLGLIKIGQSQDYSPIHGLVNQYHADADTKLIGPLVSLGTGYTFDINNQQSASLGVEGDYINYGHPTGVIHPAVNIRPNFDTLSYAYSAKSYLFMLKGKWEFTHRALLPYVSVGVGLGFNELGHYSVHANHSAAPPQNLYTSQVKQDIAYSIGIGLYQYHIRNDINLSIGYRFIYFGSGALKNPLTGGDSLSSGRLSGHFISLSLTFT